MSEEEEGRWTGYGRIIGYDNRGPLYSRPAPYCHHAISSQLGRARSEENGKLKTRFKTGTLTAFGKRIVEACPPEGIDERSLIEKLNGLSAVSDFRRDIAGLVEAGYLIHSEGRYTRAN